MRARRFHLTCRGGFCVIVYAHWHRLLSAHRGALPVDPQCTVVGRSLEGAAHDPVPVRTHLPLAFVELLAVAAGKDGPLLAVRQPGGVVLVGGDYDKGSEGSERLSSTSYRAHSLQLTLPSGQKFQKSLILTLLRGWCTGLRGLEGPGAWPCLTRKTRPTLVVSLMGSSSWRSQGPMTCVPWWRGGSTSNSQHET